MPKKKVSTQVAEAVYQSIASDATSAKFGLTAEDVEKIVGRHGSRKFTDLVLLGKAKIAIRTDKENNFTSAVMIGNNGRLIVGTAKRNRYAPNADKSVPRRGAAIALGRLLGEVAG